MQHNNHLITLEYHERGEVRPTLVVGLGGSGVYTARRLKQLILERYNIEGLIRFLYLDTDQGAMSQAPDLAQAKSEEIVSLAIAHPEQIVDEWRRDPNLHPYLEFLNGDVNVGLLRNADGAAGIRPIGRFGFHASFESVYPRLERAVQEIMQVEEQVKALMATVRYHTVVVSSQPRIYIVTSLCGGTGSGIYFDTALVLRDILLKQNLDSEIVGVFYLPSVFQHEAGISHAMREVIHANAYAALMELEYFCNTNHLNREYWEVKYRMIPPVRISEPLFDEAYLVESTNAAGRTLSTKYEVFEMAARSLLMDIGSPLGARARSAKRNSLAVIDAIRCAETDEPRLFASFAVASIAVPIKELTEYCALCVVRDKLSQRENGIYELPSLQEPEQFLRENGLTPEAIRNALTDELEPLRIDIKPEGNLQQQIDRAVNQIKQHAQNLRKIAQLKGEHILKKFHEALQNRSKEIAQQRGEAEAVQFLRSIAQIAAQISEQLISKSSEIKRLEEDLEQIPSGLGIMERFNRALAHQTRKQRAQKAESLLKQLREAYIEDETNQILRRLFNSDTESVRCMAKDLENQREQESSRRQELLREIQRRIAEFENVEHARLAPVYSLEQFACLRRHFRKFYQQHKDALQRLLNVVLEGDSVRLEFGEKREIVELQTAADMRDRVDKKIVRSIAEGIAEEVRKHANVMEFLSPLYSNETETENSEDRPYLERKVQYLMQITKPFWSAAQPPGDVRFEEFLAVSVPLSSDHFRYENRARELETAVKTLTEKAGVVAELVKDGYPFALTIMNRTYGARAYYLESVREMEHTYRKRARNPQVRAHLHLDARRFTQLPMLTPVDPKAKCCWAIALATGYVAVIDGKFYFGLEETNPPHPKFITQREERLLFDQEEYNEYLCGAYEAGDGESLLGDSYESAYLEFTRDELKIERVHGAFRRLSANVKDNALNKALDDYLERLRQRANNHRGSHNFWREEREVLIRFKPLLEAENYVLSHNGRGNW